MLDAEKQEQTDRHMEEKKETVEENHDCSRRVTGHRHVRLSTVHDFVLNHEFSTHQKSSKHKCKYFGFISIYYQICLVLSLFFITYGTLSLTQILNTKNNSLFLGMQDSTWYIWIGILLLLIFLRTVTKYTIQKHIVSKITTNTTVGKRHKNVYKAKDWFSIFYVLPLVTPFCNLLLVVVSFISWIVLMYNFENGNDNWFSLILTDRYDNDDDDDIVSVAMIYRVFICAFLLYFILFVKSCLLRSGLSNIYLKDYALHIEPLIETENYLRIILGKADIFQPNLPNFLINVPILMDVNSKIPKNLIPKMKHLHNFCLIGWYFTQLRLFNLIEIHSKSNSSSNLRPRLKSFQAMTAMSQQRYCEQNAIYQEHQ